MAAPKLKVNAPAPGTRPKLAVAAAPTSRPKLATNAAPVKRPSLKGADGQTIKAKAPTPAPTPEEDAKIAADQTAAVAQAEAAAKAEAEAAAKAEAEAEAAAQAEAEAAAQAEYERQMEEYNRQMEEYNRQMAEYEAAQAAAAAEAPVEEAPAEVAPTPAPLKTKAAPKPTALKAAPKPAALKGKPAPAPAAEETDEENAAEEAGMTEAQLDARDAYLQQLQTIADKKPFHKTPMFFAGVGALVAIGIGCYFYVSSVNAERNATKARIEATNAILKRAFEINKRQIETLDDAKAKGYTVECSKQDAQDLLNMIVDPFAKDEYGRPAYGARPKETAQLACLLLAIASELDPEIDALIFSTLDKHANTIDPGIFRTLVSRMAVSNNKGINTKFRKLAESVAARPKWSKKDDILSHIWESMGLRVTEKNIPDIVKLLQAEDISDKLSNALYICLQNIVTLETDENKKQEIGDRLFDEVPEALRPGIQTALGTACSPKALEYYKGIAENPDKWRETEAFFASYHNDDIVPYLVELRDKGKAALEAAGEDAAAGRQAKNNLNSAEFMLKNVIAQNRDRDTAAAKELIALVFDKLSVDTSDYQTLLDSEDPADQERKAEMDECFKQKEALIRMLSQMNDYKWVVEQLTELNNDPDSDISNNARIALDKVKENSAEDAEIKARQKARDKN